MKAQLDQPQGFAFDSAGRLYISDSANNRVRRIDAEGVITTVAGNGLHGYSGDGGPAIMARLSDPYGLVFDAHRNLYVAQPDEGVVRRTDTKGVITTLAGTGRPGLRGDGGPATKARLDSPFGLPYQTDRQPRSDHHLLQRPLTSGTRLAIRQRLMDLSSPRDAPAYRSATRYR